MKTLNEQIQRFKLFAHDDTLTDDEIKTFLEMAYNNMHTIINTAQIDTFLCNTITPELKQDNGGYYIEFDKTGLFQYVLNVPILKKVNDGNNLKLYINYPQVELQLKICKIINYEDDTILQSLPANIDDAVLNLALAYYFKSIQQFNLANYYQAEAVRLADFTFIRGQW